MGRGDKKTKRGKIVNGSYGRLRPRKKAKKAIAEPKAKKATKAAPKKTTAKKAAAKK